MNYCVHSGVAACSTCVSLDLARQQLDRVASEGLKAANDLTAALTRVAEQSRELGALRERLGEARLHLRRMHGYVVSITDVFGEEMDEEERAEAEQDCHNVDTFLARLDASPQAATPATPEGTTCPGYCNPPGEFCSAPCARRTGHDGRCSCKPDAATPVQGAPHDRVKCSMAAKDCPTCRAEINAQAAVQGAPPTCLGSCDHYGCAALRAAPADGPTCAAWCGNECPTYRKSWHAPANPFDFCSKACADAARPLHPAPAVPEPVREPNLGLAPSHAASPLPAEEKKT